MPLYRLLQNSAFEPLHLEAMAYAFEAACLELRLSTASDDPLREIVALKVIELAQRGERDPHQLRDRTLAEIRG